MDLGQYINEVIVLAANSRRPVADVIFDLLVAPAGGSMVVVSGVATHGDEPLELRPPAGRPGSQALTMRMVVRVTITPEPNR